MTAPSLAVKATLPALGAPNVLLGHPVDARCRR